MENSLFEQAAQITKAYGFDILSKQVEELKQENALLKQELARMKEDREDLLEDITESWVWSLSVCHQAGGKINDFENVMRNAMEAAFYRRQTDSNE